MAKILGPELKNIPWQDRPEGDFMPVWRYDANPIIGRHATKRSNSVFNSAVVPFGDGFAGVFRCDVYGSADARLRNHADRCIAWCGVRDEPLGSQL